jgi:hypothetical protein
MQTIVLLPVSHSAGSLAAPSCGRPQQPPQPAAASPPPRALSELQSAGKSHHPAAADPLCGHVMLRWSGRPQRCSVVLRWPGRVWPRAVTALIHLRIRPLQCTEIKYSERRYIQLKKMHRHECFHGGNDNSSVSVAGCRRWQQLELHVQQKEYQLSRQQQSAILAGPAFVTLRSRAVPLDMEQVLACRHTQLVALPSRDGRHVVGHIPQSASSSSSTSSQWSIFPHLHTPPCVGVGHALMQ